VSGCWVWALAGSCPVASSSVTVAVVAVVASRRAAVCVGCASRSSSPSCFAGGFGLRFFYGCFQGVPSPPPSVAIATHCSPRSWRSPRFCCSRCCPWPSGERQSRAGIGEGGCRWGATWRRWEAIGTIATDGDGGAIATLLLLTPSVYAEIELSTLDTAEQIAEAIALPAASITVTFRLAHLLGAALVALYILCRSQQYGLGCIT